VREAEKIKRIWQSETATRTVRSGVPSELHEPCLFRVQFQRELRESFAKFRVEPLGVIPMLESDQEIISKTHDDDVTARVPRSPLLDPQV
jgi:hypothetical protein